MAVTLQKLARVYPNCHVTVAAGDPDSWRRHVAITVFPSLAHWGGDPAQGKWRRRLWMLPFQLLALCSIAIIYRYLHVRTEFGPRWLRQLLTAYYDADLVLSCGGGNFYAYRRFSPAFTWATLSVAFAIWLGKSVTMLPQSFGPITGNAQRNLLAQVLSRVKSVFVRDDRSFVFLQAALPRLRVHPRLFPDLAFGLIAAERTPTFVDVSDNLNVHIAITAIDFQRQNPRFLLQTAYEDALIGFASQMAHTYPTRIYIVAQCTGPSADQDDREIAMRLYGRLLDQHIAATLETELTDAHALIHFYQQMSIVIGTRMHSGILALVVGVPVILIGYQPKTSGMMEMVGLPKYVLAIDAISADQLFELGDELLQNRHQLVLTITERVNELRAQLDLLEQYL